VHRGHYNYALLVLLDESVQRLKLKLIIFHRLAYRTHVVAKRRLTYLHLETHFGHLLHELADNLRGSIVLVLNLQSFLNLGGD
jgi:hypothetical protein